MRRHHPHPSWTCNYTNDLHNWLFRFLLATSFFVVLTFNFLSRVVQFRSFMAIQILHGQLDFTHYINTRLEWCHVFSLGSNWGLESQWRYVFQRTYCTAAPILMQLMLYFVELLPFDQSWGEFVLSQEPLTLLKSFRNSNLNASL